MVLHRMVENKVGFYHERGDLSMARFLQCFAPMITGACSQMPALAAGETAVERLKRFLHWRDEVTEAEWQKTTGWNLLTCATLLDDTAAVKELLAGPHADTLMYAKGRKIKGKEYYHQQPFAQMLINLADGHVPMMGCMAYGSPATNRAMFEAGFRCPKRDMLDVICGSPCRRATGALLNARTDNMEVHATPNPEVKAT